MKKSNNLDVKAELRRFRKSKETAHSTPHIKKTFVVEAPLLERFLSIVEQNNFKQQECISEAIALWLVKYDKLP